MCIPNSGAVTTLFTISQHCSHISLLEIQHPHIIYTLIFNLRLLDVLEGLLEVGKIKLSILQKYYHCSSGSYMSSSKYIYYCPRCRGTTADHLHMFWRCPKLVHVVYIVYKRWILTCALTCFNDSSC